MKKVCECGNAFEDATGKKRFCPECLREHRRENSRNWQRKNYKSQKRLKIGTPIKSTCKECKKDFEYHYTGGTKRVKCDECGELQRYYHNRKLSYIESFKEENELLRERLEVLEIRIAKLEGVDEHI